MEALAHNENPIYSSGGRHFAGQPQTAADAATRLADLAANYRKGESYADFDSGKLYAFALNSPQGFSQRGFQRFAPEPFAHSENAGETVFKPTTDDVTHIATMPAIDFRPPDRNIPMPPDATASRMELLSTYQTTQNLDKLLRQIEAPHADSLAGIQAQREAAESAAAVQQSGRFSRLSNSLKSWF